MRAILGHANIDVTQNVYGKGWWKERVDAVTSEMSKLSAKTGKVLISSPRAHHSFVFV